MLMKRTVKGSRLDRLRRALSGLRRRRRIVRRCSAACAAILALAAVLAALFIADWTLGMDRNQRIAAGAFGILALLWSLRRHALSHLGKREDLIDLALQVERRERIDSDLIAALEFDSEEARKWGSRDLEDAVIDYVSAYSRELDVNAGFSWKPLARRSAAAGAAIAILGGLALAFPGHAAAFLDRLLLGSAHYPTRTTIERITINGIAISPRAAESRVRVPAGRPVAIEVRAGGRLPEKGRAEMETAGGGLRTSVDLVPAEPGAYRGEFARLAEPVSWQVFLGDAWTDPARIDAIPLPVIDVEMDVSPPAYARNGGGAGDPRGSRQIAVVEGSRVAVRAACANKALVNAALSLGDREIPLAGDASGRTWTLDPKGTPFESVSEVLSFQLVATDADGLGIPEPIPCSIRIRPDRPPQVAAAMVSRHVLPAARPRLAYGAGDDFGIASIAIRRELVRGDEKIDLGLETISIPEAAPQTSVRGQHVLDLGPLKLQKDDQVTLTVEAVDYRGEAPGKRSAAEPLVLHITDERGVLAALMESDEKSARQLDAIIERQLGVGGAQ
jgi:hypothetical protein